MKTFKDHPRHPSIQPINDDEYVLEEDFSYVWEHSGIYYRINVKKGFVYDIASVPNALGWIIDMHPDGLHRTAATIHDLIYERKGKLEKGEFETWVEDHWFDYSYKEWTRKAADKMFARILRESGVSPFKRRMAYRAVRIGGWLAWKT